MVVVELELVDEEVELLEEVLEEFGRTVVGCGVTPAVVVGDKVVVGAVVEEVDDEEDEDEVVDSVVVVVSSATAEELRLIRSPTISTTLMTPSDTRDRER
jgi:D-alanine-D-alanine ligase-like ATP-grasp enzyme